MSCATCATWKPWSPTKELRKSSPSSSAGTSPGRARSPDQANRGFLGSSRIFLVPRSAPGEARDRLMETARRRFAADGAIAATLDEIRRDADVSVGALYHHFPDKPALAAAVYAELMTEYQGRFVAMLRTTCAGGPPTAARRRCCWATGWTARSCATRTRRSSPPCGIGGVRTTAMESCVRCRPESPPHCGSVRRRNSAGTGLPATNPDCRAG